MPMYHLILLFFLQWTQYGNTPQVKMEHNMNYTFPEESAPHEGTWLQWPHHYQYGKTYRDQVESTWIALTHELQESENVHIIAYNEEEERRIVQLLKEHKTPLNRIDFFVYPTDDFWVRDNGPMYVKDASGELMIQDWGFNGWGEKAKYQHCNRIPEYIARGQNKDLIQLNHVLINEGGSIEMDGNGTMMACKSSILNPNRNPDFSQEDAEHVFSTYLGAQHFIWLEGQPGIEITDQHIDGIARFGNSSTIVTMNRNDLLEFDVLPLDAERLFSATNKEGIPYSYVLLPLTQNNVVTSYGKALGYKGSYCNYYIANTKVLVPVYRDPHDEKALAILQQLYPHRKVVGIDCRNVYRYGGMIHCITQQQPKE